MILFFLLIATGLGIAVWLIVEPGFIRWRRRRWLRLSVPAAWHGWLMAHSAVYRALPTDARKMVLGLVQIFLREKNFVGCNGLVVTDEMKTVIAFEACVLVVNRPGIPLENLYDELRSILVYPTPFVVDETHHHGHGLVTLGRRVLSGQAWDSRRILLSWEDIEHRPSGGNVVLHEFAHYLDMENDAMDGAPELQTSGAYRRWSETFWAEYRQLHQDLAAGKSTLLDPYAAVEPAEFFAVATEFFFEQGKLLAEQHPALYEQLRSYYRIDPATW